MNVIFDKSFERALLKIKNQMVYRRVEKTILQIEKSENLSEIANLRKMSGFSNYYRIRIGDFRIGFELIDESNIRLITIAHRKEIYKNFP
jgi:mRNA interferase RelE/StbE